MLKEYEFKKSEKGVFVPMGASGHVGPDVSHKLYTFGAASCLIIAGVNKAKKEGFLAHLTSYHDFEPLGRSFNDTMVTEFGLTNKQLLDFHENGGKIFVIASPTANELLKQAKEFLEKNGIDYELVHGDRHASAVVDHENGAMHVFKLGSKGPEPGLNYLFMMNGGTVATHEGGKTKIPFKEVIG